METDYVFAAFRSRQHVLEFDAKLREAGIDTRIISTPHELAQGCGLSVKLNEKDYPRARKVLDGYRPEAFVGFYRAYLSGGRMKYEAMMKRSGDHE